MQVYGKVLEKTPEREWYVAKAMIQKWLDSGLDEGAVARTWNQGNPGPCVKGINKYNVPYDSCTYEKKILALLQ